MEWMSMTSDTAQEHGGALEVVLLTESPTKRQRKHLGMGHGSLAITLRFLTPSEDVMGFGRNSLA